MGHPPEERNWCPRKTWLSLIAPALLAAILFGQAQPSNGAGKEPSLPALRVSLSVAKRIYKVGEAIQVTYRIENISANPVYVHPNILVGESVSGFRIEIFDERGHSTPQRALEAFFTGYQPGLDAFDLVRRSWLLMPPQAFYGRRDELPAADYDALKKPGRYKLVATYYDTTLEWFTTQQKESLKKLDYPVWSGEVSSDPIWIDVRK